MKNNKPFWITGVNPITGFKPSDSHKYPKKQKLINISPQDLKQFGI